RAVSTGGRRPIWLTREIRGAGEARPPLPEDARRGPSDREGLRRRGEGSLDPGERQGERRVRALHRGGSAGRGQGGRRPGGRVRQGERAEGGGVLQTELVSLR